MKTLKETVYEFIQQEIYSTNEYKNGLETKTVAEALGLHRSNVSALLNELVKEGKLSKTTTRPVYYKLPDQINQSSEKSCFTQLIGYNGSLRNAIQLAQAAILYPRSSLNVLLSSKTGCGTTYFASLMFEFAKEMRILSKTAPYIKIDCRHYSKNVSILNDDLFGNQGDLNNSCFARAQGGMLFLDNVDLLDAKQQSFLFKFLDSGKIFSEDKTKNLDCNDLFLVLACSPQSGLQINRIIPVTIELPELKDRSMEERFELINHFFQVEASNSERSIEVTAESIKALLLSEFNYNVKGLELDIKAACANAYVRVVNESEQPIYVCVNDFKGQIKKSLLNLKGYANEIDALIGKRDSIIYDKNIIDPNYYDPHSTVDMYSEIKKQYDELSNLGITDSGIENVMNTHIHNLFKKYRYYNGFDDSNNLEQLSKIVDPRIIEMVNIFLDNCKKGLGINYKSNVFYGLCLHVNSLLTINLSEQRIDNNQIIKIVQDYPKEYAASVQFATILKEKLNLNLPIHEVVLIAMFLIESDENSEEDHPVMLYIMHGSQTASSLKDVTNSLTHCHNSYSYDLALDIGTRQAMEEIKALIEKIDRGKGVIVIYDMGSIKTMLDTISEEIDVKIRYINMPITLIGIDVARKCSMESDIDYVYHMANLEINSMKKNVEKHNNIIVTLCHTGEGGAAQLKLYIDQYSKLGMKTIALAISSRNELLREVLALQKTYNIHSFVGAYDPKLFGIPFISIQKVFESSKEDLDRILMFEPVNSRSVDYNDVYKYLGEQFKYTSISKLKTVLPNIIDEFSMLYQFTEDQRVGLFMHLACLVERLLDGKSVVSNNDRNKLISVFKEDYQAIVKILKPLERTFKIIIDDNEITTIIMIIKKV
ncbi:PRD domain-containing protein [Clostridium sp. YIM B02505]|uniref:PRD domain-containing protein n=1 Tax=Clostridium yunnanense TaxID=2800325 RepID=A0ABS1ES33_9CLOT|nr:PRD domain-containing protein [Clostridium yunnanense]MBK1812199.1 PRD domain-containing protein [Clostridium yunnanense]